MTWPWSSAVDLPAFNIHWRLHRRERAGERYRVQDRHRALAQGHGQEPGRGCHDRLSYEDGSFISKRAVADEQQQSSKRVWREAIASRIL